MLKQPYISIQQKCPLGLRQLLPIGTGSKQLKISEFANRREDVYQFIDRVVLRPSPP